jgi:glycerol-3-phosphate dehydrogenase subunit C
MGGAYGFDKSNYKRALEIRSKLVTEIHENPTDRIVTDCGGCKLQIEAGCGITVEHPIILLQ